MMRIANAVATATIAMALALPVFAQSNSPKVTVPSGQNSGAGIPGQPGNKNGPPAGQTVGSKSKNEAVREQDSSGVKGLPGNKSGPAEKPPAQQK